MTMALTIGSRTVTEATATVFTVSLTGKMLLTLTKFGLKETGNPSRTTPGPGQLPRLALDFTNLGSLGGNWRRLLLRLQLLATPLPSPLPDDCWSVMVRRWRIATPGVPDPVLGTFCLEQKLKLP
ncbi:Protein of unknown function [Gryllus bimaculatus]|nr:Protein of unknown function [Gryllus bimaculatus]